VRIALSVFLWICLSIGSAFASALPEPAEPLVRLREGFASCLAAKDSDSLLTMVWWQGADRAERASLTTAFSELVKMRFKRAVVVPPGAGDSLFGSKDSSLRTDLEVKAVLRLEFQVGPSEDDVFEFEYPLGVSGGKWWILPVLEAS
jgi:hypothetical protein